MTFPVDALPPLPERPRVDVPVRLRTGVMVPFDVLLGTWVAFRQLNEAARASLLLLIGGRRREVPPVTFPLLRTLGMLDSHDDVLPVVVMIVSACFGGSAVGLDRKHRIHWVPPTEWLAP